MITLDSRKKKITGIEYVLNELEVLTPFGADKIKRLSPYPKKDADKLAAELHNVSTALEAIKTGCVQLSRLKRIMPKFKDIRGSVKKLSDETENAVLSEVELFEIKAFLIAFLEFHECFLQLAGDAGFTGLETMPLNGALDVLDPGKTKLSSFYLSELHSEKLGKIRKRKREAELAAEVCKNPDELKILKKKRLEITVAEEEEELQVKRRLTAELKPFREAFLHNIETIGRLDLIIAKAALAKRLGAVPPKITENSIVLKNVINPEVDHILRNQGKAMTPVSIELAPGTAVLTGANMGGKSVALKTLVMSIYLFQCGFFVFAGEAEFPMFDAVYYIAEDMQSVYTGLSSFGAEIVELNGIIGGARAGFSLVVLDEPAKGTNPHEGRVIVSALAEYLNSFCSITIISTHYDGVAGSGMPRYMTAGLDREKLGKAGKYEEPSPKLISKYMDYRLVKPPDTEAAPTEALDVCRLLALDAGLMELIEKKYVVNAAEK